MREGDAEPDEIAVISDTGAKIPESESDDEPRPATPGGQSVPKTVVEVTPDADGSVTLPEIEKKHKADPPPDLVLEDQSTRSGGGHGQGASGTDA